METPTPRLRQYLVSCHTSKLPASLLGLFYLLLNVGVRLRIAWPLFSSPEISGAELFLVFLVGLANDLAAGLSMIIPVALLLCVWPGRSFAKKTLLASLFTIEFLCLMVILGIDLASWLELDTRAGRFGEQYIVYLEATTHFAIEYAQEIAWYYWLAGIGVIATIAALGALVSPVLTELSCAKSDRRNLAVVAALSFSVLTLYFIAGEWQISEKRSINDAAENSTTKAFRNVFRRNSKWNGVFADIADSEAHERLSRIWPEATPEPASGIRHVLLIVEESFGGDYWIDSETREEFMPEFLRLAQEGRLFTNAYATGMRTVRGIEALLQGIIPVPGFSRTTLGEASHLPSLGGTLQAAGFQTGFVYGGWPSFTNLANYWSSTGYDRVLVRDDFPDPWFETSWGLADEIVLDRLLEEMDEMTGSSDRVFLSTLTISNHLPFTFPAGRIGYPPGERAHAIAYADWALGRFMEQARNRPWFEDTLFVIASDHGYGKLGNARVPIEPHRIPVLFFAPNHVSPGSVDALTSSLEVPKTILCMLGLPECQQFHGRDLLQLTDGDHGVAPIEWDSLLALVNLDSVTILLRDKSVETWRWDESGLLRPSHLDPEMSRNASAVFRTAMQDFYGELR